MTPGEILRSLATAPQDDRHTGLTAAIDWRVSRWLAGASEQELAAIDEALAGLAAQPDLYFRVRRLVASSVGVACLPDGWSGRALVGEWMDEDSPLTYWIERLWERAREYATRADGDERLRDYRPASRDERELMGLLLDVPLRGRMATFDMPYSGAPIRDLPRAVRGRAAWWRDG